ncbi:hypothetical protein AAF712_006458 [Marasmius tenuissimus]|uniref:F-box domain-containing protein n=1 Tax=Marasmius tenuissimus TaxID=585030 RepID=A0ABR2ZXU5_9AGAR
MPAEAPDTLMQHVNSVLKLPEDKDINYLIQSNAPLRSSVQRKILFQMVVERIAILENLDFAIRDGHDPAGLYSCARVFLTGQVQIFKGVLSPIRGVPVEILAQVFELVVDDALYVIRSQPLALGQVCSRWRTVSHDTPRLWRKFRQLRSCNNQRTGPGGFDVVLDAELTSLWFQRAYPHPVDVELNLGKSSTPTSLIPTLAHAQRIGELTLITDDFEEPPPLPKDILATLSFPLLRKLHVTGFFDRAPGHTLGPLFAHLSAPQLTDAHINLETILDLQWCGHSLRSLNLSMHSVNIPVHRRSAIFAMLRNCPQLVHLNLNVDGQLLWADSPLDIRLPKLKTFVLDTEGSFRNDIGVLFSTLVLPELESLVSISLSRIAKFGIGQLGGPSNTVQANCVPSLYVSFWKLSRLIFFGIRSWK